MERGRRILCVRFVIELFSHLNCHLTKHIREVHEQAKKFHCEFCDKKFKRNSDLTIHLDALHAKSDQYKCDICEK